MTDLNELNSGPPVEAHREHIKDDNYVYNELKRIFLDSSDAFGKLIADSTRNIFDFASHYDFSPERLRLFANGTRINPQYTNDPRFTDEADIWRLSPTAGDTMHIESAESVTYLVNYVVDISHAFQINQSLRDGDRYRFGAYDGVDGWVMEQRGEDHADDEVDILEYRNGTREVLESNVTLPRPLTSWHRYQLNYNWYNVGAQVWRQTYTEGGNQFNKNFATTSTDGERGPTTANLNIWTEIEAGSNTDNLELEAGSLGAILFGSPRTVSRSKPQPISVDTSGTNDTWEPVYALRVNPNNEHVNSKLKELDIIDFGANDTAELVIASFDADNTDIQESDWGTPEYHHETNSVIQETTNVSEVPNTNGTQKVLEAGEKYGGYTALTSIIVGGGNIAGSSSTVTPEEIDRNNLLKSDHYVFLVRTDTAATLWFEWRATQEW